MDGQRYEDRVYYTQWIGVSCLSPSSITWTPYSNIIMIIIPIFKN
jgi:hypothetical protein